MHRFPRLERPLLAALLVQGLFGIAFIATSSFRVTGALHFTLFDDAMISMRFARNLVEGAGLVWNPGEAPVEGYSNLLWTLWMAALHLAAPGRLVSLLVAASGLAILLANTAVVWRLARTVAPGAPAVWHVAVVSTVACYSLAYWTLRGLEVGAVALCINAAALALVSPDGRWRLPALAAALALLPPLRADGIVPAALLAGWYVVQKDVPWRHRAMVLAAPLITFAAQELFRLSYYGAWLPNTYYLKVAGVPLLWRIERGTLQFGLTTTWALWPLLAFALLSQPLAAARRLLAAIVLVMCAYSIYVGADAWEWTGHVNRYLAAALGPAIVLAACGIDAFAGRLARGDRRIAPLLLLLVGVAVHALVAFRFYPERELSVLRVPLLVLLGLCWAACGLALRNAGKHWARPLAVGSAAALVVLTLSGAKLLEWVRFGDLHVIDDRFMGELGVRLRDVTANDARIAVVWAGAVPYFSRRHTVDLLGKSDPYIARLPSRRPFVPGHSKWDYAHSVAAGDPDVVLQLWAPTAADEALLAARGYVKGPAGVWVSAASPRVDRPALFALVEDVQRRRSAASARPH